VDLETVRTFVAVAEAGQFSEAADDLSITQQAVSKRVAALEKSLSVRLFARTARGVRLTADGQAFLPPARELLAAAEAARVLDEPVQLLTGPKHAYADAGAIKPAELAGLWIWMPGVVPGTEWGAYYQAFASSFGLTIDTTGPSSGTEPLLDVVAASPAVATLVGEHIHLLWPDDYDLRRIPLHDPTPVYPHSLIWRTDNPHPSLTALRDHFDSATPARPGTWVPAWAT
jgi:DNA-binding transcriptional LysR family regulator